MYFLNVKKSLSNYKHEVINFKKLQSFKKIGFAIISCTIKRFRILAPQKLHSSDKYTLYHGY
ncbi:hypothetical protein D3C87_158130 [compost metagenome]